MQILIVDDEELARQRLDRMLDKIDSCEVVGHACDGVDAIAKVESLDPELVLLDVRMPEKDGLEVAEQLSELQDPPAIIFCTAYDEYALQAFGTLAVGYLVKPVSQEQLEAAIEKAQSLNKLQRRVHANSDAAEQDGARKHISAKTRRGLELIPIEEVYCFVADQKYVTVHHAGGETLIDDTLKELESEFSVGFVRVHRNSLVCLSQIAAMERVNNGYYELKLKSSDVRPVVSRRHLSGLRSLLESL